MVRGGEEEEEKVLAAVVEEGIVLTMPQRALCPMDK